MHWTIKGRFDMRKEQVMWLNEIKSSLSHLYYFCFILAGISTIVPFSVFN